MTLHVLSGDSLLGPFRASGIAGDVAVFRECLVDGPCAAGSIDEFFRVREKFLEPDNDSKAGFYSSQVIPEIEKVLSSPPDIPINLWFEHELFCQVNLWFLLYHLADTEHLYFVPPPVESDERRFAGWADVPTEGLVECLESAVAINESDRDLGSKLWQAFSRSDGSQILELSRKDSKVFRFLDETASAAASIDSEPKELVRKIARSGADTFADVFREFCRTHPVYGFGDLQVERIWNEVRE